MTNHDLWEEQALEDFRDAQLALFNAVNDLDADATSWEGIEPGQAAARLRQIAGMVEFALAASVQAGAGRHAQAATVDHPVPESPPPTLRG